MRNLRLAPAKAKVAVITKQRKLMYRDRRTFPIGDPAADARFERVVRETCTLYVGNLSFFTTEEQIWATFQQCGHIKRLVMGLNRETMTPCGFCFVEYSSRASAVRAYHWVNRTRVDERSIRVDWDSGFVEGRQYGRGTTGVQVRDELLQVHDPGRTLARPAPAPQPMKQG